MGGREGDIEGHTIRVAILDDHTIVSAGLAALIDRDAQDVEVVWAGVLAADLLAALDAGLAVDVVLLDVMLGPCNPSGGAVAADLSDRGVATILVTMLSGGPSVKEALLAGAADYIAKNATEQDLLAVIHSVAAGEVLRSREAVAILSESLGPHLSPQEAAVVRLYVQGLPLRIISKRLSLSENTCNTYLKRVRAKFRHAGRTVDSRFQLREVAIAEGVIDPAIENGGSGPGGTL